MGKHKELSAKIQGHLPLHGARLNFIARFILAVIVVRGVTLSTVASALNPSVLNESNEKRIKRFFSEVTLERKRIAKLIVALIPTKTSLVLTLDRTNWCLGTHSVNILMLGIAYKGLAFPLLWTLLEQEGNSDTQKRLELIDTFLSLIPAEQVEAVVADREFIGEAWFKGLRERKLSFVMRVRNNSLITSKGRTRSAQRRYNYLKPQEVYICPKRCWLFNLRVYLAVTKTKEGELLVLACNIDPDKALPRYAQRWQIETLFSALKTRGFNLEDTHMLQTQRFNVLLALLAIAFTWAHLVGEWCYQQRPLKLKAHGYLPKSYFKRGLDTLRSAILAGNSPAKIDLDQCLGLLSP